MRSILQSDVGCDPNSSLSFRYIPLTRLAIIQLDVLIARILGLTAFGFPEGFVKEPSVPMPEPVLIMIQVPTAKSAFESALKMGSRSRDLSACHACTSLLAFLKPIQVETIVRRASKY